MLRIWQSIFSQCAWTSRISPFTYLIEGMIATALANIDMHCPDVKLLKFKHSDGKTCGSYIADYIAQAGGYLVDKKTTFQCEYCSMSSTNDFLANFNSYYNQRWRNWGIFVCFIAINMILTVFYWLARVPKGRQEIIIKTTTHFSWRRNCIQIKRHMCIPQL